ncbi:unnamed protein product [Diamesa hyperborea]
MDQTLSTENPVLRSYIFWSSILVIKMVLMGPLTALQRLKKKAFANAEDLMSKKLKVKFGDEDVERVRRAHRNDLENILPFFIAGFFYLLTNPSVFIAVNLFRAAAIARIVHTLVYAVVVVPQPARGIAFFVCMGATFYMSISTAIYFM